MLNFSIKEEKIVERRSGVLYKVEFLMYNKNLPYGRSNVHLSQQGVKSLKYTRAASILLG
jgi:hypothetical protein